MEQTTATPTPTSTPSAAPASSPGTVNSPSPLGNARAALEFADSSTAAPETPTQTPAVAVTPPSGDTPVVESPSTDPKGDRSPHVDRARFDAVNERMKTAETTLKQYEGFRDFQPEELPELMNLGRAYKADPVGATVTILENLLSNPQYAAALQARMAPHAGRMLAANRGKEAADVEPTFMVDTGNGHVAFDPEAFAQWRDWYGKQIESRFEQKLQPLQEVTEKVKRSERLATYSSTTGEVIARMKTADPDFAKHTKDVGEAINADPRLQRMAIGDPSNPAIQPDPETAIEIAWARVLRAKVLPQRDQQTRESVLADFQQRAAAGTTNPGAASTSAPPNMIGNARAALQYAESVVGAA